MSTQAQIESKLQAAFTPTFLEVLNESHKHNVPPGSESHFKVTVVSAQFDDRHLVARHRLVNKTLAEELAGTGVMVNALHPATYMPTGMVTRAGVEPRATIAEGADAVMQLITSMEVESGQFFRGLEPSRAHEQAYDRDARARLKQLSQELGGMR